MHHSFMNDVDWTRSVQLIIEKPNSKNGGANNGHER